MRKYEKQTVKIKLNTSRRIGYGDTSLCSELEAIPFRLLVCRIVSSSCSRRFKQQATVSLTPIEKSANLR